MIRAKGLDAWGRLIFFATSLSALFLVLNAVSLGGGDPTDTSASEGGLKAHHFFSGVLFVLLALRPSLPRLHWTIILFFLTCGTVTALSSLFYEQNPQAVNLIYCLVLTIAFCKAGNAVGPEPLKSIFQLVFGVALVAVVVKNLFSISEIMGNIASGGRVWIHTLVGGGVNQEGALLALGAAFFIGTRLFYPYLGAVMFINLLYLSRGGVLMCVALLAIYWLIQFKKSRKRLFGIFGAAVFAAGLISVLPDSVISYDRLIERFTDSQDKGNLGRMSLWDGAKDALSKNLLGYGAMNAVPVIEKLAGEDFVEDNLHNIYLQILVDTGIFGFAAYILMIGWIFKSIIRGNAGPFGVFLIVYYVFGLIRFRGYDPFAFMIVGALQSYLICSSKNSSSSSE